MRKIKHKFFLEARAAARTMKNSNVRDWYMKEYPTDSLGKELEEELTFDALNDALKGGCGDRFYDVVGVRDSLVRERIFDKLAEIFYRGDYYRVYNMWLHPNGDVNESRRDDDKVLIFCYDKPEVRTRTAALRFYDRGTRSCDEGSSEWERYVNIIDKLSIGYKVLDDSYEYDNEQNSKELSPKMQELMDTL